MTPCVTIATLAMRLHCSVMEFHKAKQDKSLRIVIGGQASAAGIAQ